MIIRTYRAGDEVGIVGLLKQCFDDFNRWNVTTDDWLSYEEGDYGFRRDNALVAELEGRLVGHLHLVLRRVHLGGSAVDFCGIANVSTHPEFRGRGIATSLVRKAVEVCRERGIPAVSLLTGYGGEGYRVYRSVGFSKTALLRVYVGTHDGAERFLKRYGRRKLGVEEISLENIDEVMRLYDLLRYRVNLTVERPKDYWVNKVLKRFYFYSFFYDRPEAATKLLFRDSSTPVGYSLAFSGRNASRSYWQKDAGIILEAVAINETYLGSVISETLRLLLDSGAKVLRLYLPTPYRHLLTYSFEELGGPLLMDYVADPVKLLKGMAGDLSKRAAVTGLEGSVTISMKSPYGCASICLADSGVEVLDTCESENEIEFTNDGFVKALYGVSSLEKLVDEDQVVRMRLSSHSFRALKTLFPVKPIYIPRLDQW